MKVYVEGRGPIALEAIKLLEKDHTIVTNAKDSEAVVWCRGNTWDKCVVELFGMAKGMKHKEWVIVTSEHGDIPTTDSNYTLYHSIKAAQKMLVRCMVEWGSHCVDVSPAFVMDASPEKRINKDPVYASDVETACNDTFPVTCNDVAKAIVFALENCGTMSGSVIKVSAGWTQGRI